MISSIYSTSEIEKFVELLSKIPLHAKLVDVGIKATILGDSKGI